MPTSRKGYEVSRVEIRGDAEARVIRANIVPAPGVGGESILIGTLIMSVGEKHPAIYKEWCALMGRILREALEATGNTVVQQYEVKGHEKN